MKRPYLFVLSTLLFSSVAFAQKAPIAKVQTAVKAEENFNKIIARKGIKDGFLEVADAEGFVYKPNMRKISDFYGSIEKQPGVLVSKPTFARISAAGDLAFTAGPYEYHNSKNDDDKVYGNYLSVWRGDGSGELKLLINLGIQHPEPDNNTNIDFEEPDTAKHGSSSRKDPFAGKILITNTDKTLNQALALSSIGAYKEFLSPNGRYFFPGFPPMTGVDQTMKFLANQAITITAENQGAGRAASNDLAYSYGTARIKKGNIVSSFNYVRIWEIDAKKRWNVLLEVLSAVEK